MKKWFTLFLLFMSITLFAGCRTGTDQNPPGGDGTPTPTQGAAEQMTLRLSTNHTEDYPTGKAVAKFSELVKQKSNGAITIDVYYNAVLGDEKASVEQLQYGGLDFVRVSISPLAEFVDDFNALQMPYIYRDSEHYWKVLNGDVGMNLLKSNKMLDNNMYGLCYYDAGARSFYFSKAKVRTPADMKGLSIRVQESALMMGMVSAMGGSPTPMAAGEIYSALQTGVVDGAENNLPYYLSQSHNEVAPFITLDEHTRAPDCLIMSKKLKDSLTAEQLQIMEEAALESSDYQRELWADSEKEAEEKCIELGSEIIRLTAEEKQQFMDIVKDLNAKEGAKYKEILDGIAKE
jgi:tripartite ATP-independent transporter DctP family solute receptor